MTLCPLCYIHVADVAARDLHAFARAILMRWRAFFSSFLRPATRASMKRSSTRSRPTAYLGVGLGEGLGLGLGLG